MTLVHAHAHTDPNKPLTSHTQNQSHLLLPGVFFFTIARHIGRLRQTSPLLQQISQATDGTLQLATWDLQPAFHISFTWAL